MTENDYACTFTCMLYMYYINHFILGTWKYLKFLDLKVCFKTDYKLHFTQWLLVINDIDSGLFLQSNIASSFTCANTSLITFIYEYVCYECVKVLYQVINLVKAPMLRFCYVYSICASLTTWFTYALLYMHSLSPVLYCLMYI